MTLLKKLFIIYAMKRSLRLSMRPACGSQRWPDCQAGRCIEEKNKDIMYTAGNGRLVTLHWRAELYARPHKKIPLAAGVTNHPSAREKPWTVHAHDSRRLKASQFGAGGIKRLCAKRLHSTSLILETSKLINIVSNASAVHIGDPFNTTYPYYPTQSYEKD
jgi:hypothetical protein